jgi:predicted nucleic acid-binding protein
VATHLVDTSTLARARSVGLWDNVIGPLLAGRWALCDIVVLEILRGAAASIYRDLSLGLRAMPQVALLPRDTARALEMQELLAGRGHHQGVKVPDLLVAAAAERSGLIVMCHDHDFDLIAEVSGQRVDWFPPRPSPAVAGAARR